MSSSTTSATRDYNEAQAQLDYVYVKHLEVVITNSEKAELYADSVVDADNLIRPQSAKQDPLASLSDFGIDDPRVPCNVCSALDCPGHIVFLRFPTTADGNRVMIVNPAYLKRVKNIMAVVCHECNNILANPKTANEKRQLEEIEKLPANRKLPALMSLLGLEGGASKSSPACTLGTMINGKKVLCATKHKLASRKAGKDKDKKQSSIVFEVAPARSTKQKGSTKAKAEEKTFLPRDAYKILTNISPWQLHQYIGLTLDEVKGYFMEGVSLVPPRYRASATKTKTDKITTIISNIEKHCRNTSLESTELINKLTEEVEKYYDAIRDINKSKIGHFRKFVAGKRSTYTARPVIVPTKDLPIDVVTIPRRIASRGLLFPITVTESNLEEVQSMYFEGKIAEINKAAGGPNPWETIVVSPDNYSNRGVHRIGIGDVVHRKLQDGDILLHGRQPTHNVHSQLGVQAMVVDSNTMGVSTNVAEEYHGDFDGDTMWIALLQTLEARGEAATINNVLRLMRNYKSNTINIGVIYNGLLSAALLTRRIPKPEGGFTTPSISPVMHASVMAYISAPGRPVRGGDTRGRAEEFAKYERGPFPQRRTNAQDRFDTYADRLAKHGVDPYTGAGLFSLLLPPDFNYEGGKKSANRYVTIRDGVLVSGTLSKYTLASNTINAIPDRLHQDYEDGYKLASRFINEANYLLGVFLNEHGYTVSMSACNIGPSDDPRLEAAIKKVCDEVEVELLALKQPITRLEEEEYEKDIQTLANKLSSVGINMMEETEDLSNWLLYMSEAGAGAKGKKGNLHQMFVMLGQQTISGKRPVKNLTNGMRCLPTEVPGETTLDTLGFISNNYASGLTPNESYYSAANNFQGVAQNATNTPHVGKVQRYMQIAAGEITTMKGAAVFRDKVVLQWCYGGDGYDGMKLEKVDDEFQAVNMAAILNKYSY